MFLGGVLFVWTNAGTAWVAARLGRRLLPGAGFATRVLAGWILFVALTLASLLALGAVGLLAPVPQALLVGVLVLAAWLPGSGAAPADPPEPASPDGLSRLAWVVAGAVFLWSCAAVLTNSVSFGWDTLTYHAVSPAWWIQHGSLALPPFNYQSYYPLNVELHALWFTLPFGLDANSNLGSISWLAILFAAFAVHARVLRQQPWLVALALCGFMLAPKVSERLPFHTSPDLAMATVLLAMLAFTWTPDADRRALGRALLCGVAGGLALGMKPTAAPLVTLAGLFWIWRGWRLQGGARHVGAFVVGVLLLGAPWYARNWLATGNPLFPADIGPFDGPLTATAQRATSLAPTVAAAWSEPGGSLALLKRLLDWPLWLGLAAAFGYAAGLWGLLRARDRLQRVHISLILVAGLGFLALFPLTPFSGTPNRPDASTVYYVRYITFWFLNGLVLLPSLAPMRKTPALAGGPTGSRPRAVLPAVVLLALVGVALSTPARARGAATQLAGPTWSALGPAWTALESLPDGARIAVYPHDPPSHALIYPLFGRRLQFEPVAINLDGTPRRPLHETWREHADDWWWEFAARGTAPPAGIILRNLRAAGVEYLLLADWPGNADPGDWDPTHPRWRFPKLLGADRLLYTSPDAVLWDIRAEEPTR
jgi:hypothetical protein